LLQKERNEIHSTTYQGNLRTPEISFGKCTSFILCFVDPVGTDYFVLAE
jgi:hypothetical protein